MGYIPPIRDEQAFLYGNRVIHAHRGIKRTSPIMESKFQRLLSEHEKKTYYQQKRAAQSSKKRSKRMMSEQTGKGSFIDEVI